VSLERSTKDLPIESIAIHAEVAHEAGEEYKRYLRRLAGTQT
jgi:hypothetical protein